MAGLEPTLAEELSALGAQEIEPLTRAVACSGDQRLLYRANLELRTALRVLIPVETFRARDEKGLYRGIYGIDWSAFMGPAGTLAVDSSVSSELFNHSKYVALKTKDAIVDQFRDRYGRRPNVRFEDPSLRVNVHIWQDQCTVSIDASGDSLHKRGYRSNTMEAPINEVLAAGLVLLSGWRRDCAFVDPMCGSGTILIEAALYAMNVPPQMYRQRFGFMNWKDYDNGLWQSLKREAEARIQPFNHGLWGYDIDFRAIGVCRQNLLGAHLEGKVNVERRNFERLDPPAPGGLLIMNPPYDERLQLNDIGALYKAIGDTLKQRFSGYRAWIISANKEALKHIGLRPSKKFTLFNGALECRYLGFELYEGRKGV